MAVSVKLSDEIVASARQQAQVFQRTLGGQVDTTAPCKNNSMRCG